eukprot:CAMPEP_0170783394 /NCGR_PEP_ID=MMETSP0733-20121128/15502_1 /TAXON_ID=186038 /ORGANISM="Fragilariopsis kerguelensis, Strain L26-C5" /LENGTH=72 /DNA_ID=CAMNT_0011128083 /DNA_START=199 /DNA_END=417 /DNA_ORIENTATION=-
MTLDTPDIVDDSEGDNNDDEDIDDDISWSLLIAEGPAMTLDTDMVDDGEGDNNDENDDDDVSILLLATEDPL